MLARYQAKALDDTWFEVDCQDAIKVHLLVNVMEVVRVNGEGECFAAVFTLHMWWTDPSLKGFQSALTVKPFNDGPHKVEGVIRSRCPDALLVSVARGEEQDDLLLRVPTMCVVSEKQPEWDSAFFPKFSFMNLASPAEVLVQSQELVYVAPDGGFVHYKAKYLATFREKLELEEFPFDRQLCVIKVSAELAAQRFQFVPVGDTGRHSGSFSTDDEWTVAADIQRKCTFYVRPLSETYNSHEQRSNFRIIMHLQRKATFYLSNVGLMLFVLSMSSACSFFVDLGELGDRLSILVTFLLLAVMYKYIVNDWIPRKPYWTAMDKYIMTVFAFQLVPIIESCALAHLDDEEQRQELDAQFCGTWYSMWLLMHTTLLLCYRCGRMRSSWRVVYGRNDEPFFRGTPCCRCQLAKDGKTCSRCGASSALERFTPLDVAPEVGPESLPSPSPDGADAAVALTADALRMAAQAASEPSKEQGEEKASDKLTDSVASLAAAFSDLSRNAALLTQHFSSLHKEKTGTKLRRTSAGQQTHSKSSPPDAQ